MSWMEDIRKAAKETEKSNVVTRENLLTSTEEKEPKSQSTYGEVYDDGVLVKRADGTLTDYGKMLQGQTEAQKIASTYKPPTGFNTEKGMYGGMTPTYEAYVAGNVGNAVMGKEDWLRSMAESKNKYAEDFKKLVPAGTTLAQTQGTPQFGASRIQQIGSTQTGQLTLQQQLAEAQKRKTISALEQAYQRATGSLEAEKSGLDPIYGAQTRQAVAQGAMAKKSFADFLAEKGVASSGLAGQGEISQNVALQSQLGGIEANKSQALSDIARRQTEAQQTKDYGVANAEIDAQINLAEQQLADARTAEERAYAQKQLDDARAYNAQLMAQEQAYNRQQTLEERAYQEQQNKAQQDREDYLMNIGQFSQNYQKEINNLLAQGVPETDYRIMALRNQRTQKLGAMAEAEQNAYVQAMKDEQAKQEQAFELAKWRFESGLPATQMDSQLLGVPVGKISPAQAIKQAELQLAKIRAAKTSSNAKKTKSPVTLTDYEQALKSTFTDTDTPESKAKKAAQYIVNNKDTITNDIIQRLATRYGVTEQMIQDYVNMEKFNVMKNL